MNETTLSVLVMLVSACVAFVISWVSGRRLIPVLHRLKFGQTIRDIGPAWHKNKQGTPTMGGVMFILAFVVTLVLAFTCCELFLDVKPVTEPFPTDTVRLLSGISLTLACGVIGFADDYIKVVKKRNLGLTALQKIVLQLVAATSYAVVMYVWGDAGSITIPFTNIQFGFWIVPLCIFFAVGFPNATNLTDGVDGLCGSVTVVASCCFAVAAMMFGKFGLSLTAIVFAGAMVGFLMWNLHPAKVFMGDTGSLLIGGLLCALAFGIGEPFLLLPVGIMYIIETLSVMLQVGYFKLTHGKRLFKMSPIHHHFEMCGWSENKIVSVFSVITALCGCGALMLMLLLK